MSSEPLPDPGDVWIKRKTGDRYEVWYAYPKLVGLRPLRAGRSRPVQLNPNNLFQEYEPEPPD